MQDKVARRKTVGESLKAIKELDPQTCITE